MVGSTSLALRRSAVNTRLDAALDTLRERHGIDAPIVAMSVKRNPELLQVTRDEHLADVLDLVIAGLPKPKRRQPSRQSV